MKYDNILIINFKENPKPSILVHCDSLCHCALVAIKRKACHNDTMLLSYTNDEMNIALKIIL